MQPDAAPSSPRRAWRIADVVDVDGAAAACRNDWEFRDLREVLADVTRGKAPNRAYDIGCGYGRLLNLLGEVARVLRPSGSIILVEETDETLEAGSAAGRADLGYTTGRSGGTFSG